MLKLEGGIELPLPKGVNSNPFSMPRGISKHKTALMMPELWQRAYSHCLFFLHGMFDNPLHAVVPWMAKSMMEAKDGHSIALRFIGEMHLQGYVRLRKRKQQGTKDKYERIILPTKKLLNLNLSGMKAPDSVVVLPKIVNEDKMPRTFAIRNGISNRDNKRKVNIVRDIADEQFTINNYIHDLLEKYPPVTEEVAEYCMFERCMNTAELLRDKVFRFPYFLDSRGRMYVATTCGITPQGADHEKALIEPTFNQKLTPAGFEALVAAAHGYSEIEWTPQEMADHAFDPDAYYEIWMSADKPYCYMACAELIRLYLEDPTRPIPAFMPRDGRCSGLQHWSALVRSPSIVKHLGMHEEEADRDIYERIADDWKEALVPELKYLATRKAAKVPTMTWAYNATRMTSMDHLKKLYGVKRHWDFDKAEYVVDEEGLLPAATANLGCDLYDHLNKTLKDLTEAVTWVSDAAEEISRAGFADITWVTPDGFVCKQRKTKGVRRQLSCTLSDKSELLLEILDFTGSESDPAKHRSAIAPNIIHSLDATHLRMVARKLKQLGDPMIFIHDSFATHCNFEKTLYSNIVDTFIQLYSRNYLAELYDYWTEEYGVCLSDPPELGSWEPESLRNLTRFFL
jgi:DNA-directed RNA polymerase